LSNPLFDPSDEAGKVDSVSAQTTEEEVQPAPDPPVVRRGLHQPVRAAVAAGELVLAAVVIVAAIAWVWPKTSYTVVTVLDDGTRFESIRNVGHWMALGIVLGAIAGVLVLDAVRQFILAVRAKPLRSRSKHAAHS
jgi:hypothetical protein